LALLALVGCRGKDIYVDCEHQAMKFNAEAAKELDPLLETIPTTGPYPVTIEISSAGLNKLLANIVKDGVPFAGTVPFGPLPQGPTDAQFVPTSTPEIRLVYDTHCTNCVVFHLEFGVQLMTPDEPVSSGVGLVDLLIPIRLDVDPASRTATLVAEYGNAKIARDKPECAIDDREACGFYVNVYGFNSVEHTMLAGALKLFMEEQIKEEYTDKELLTIGGWDIGDGAIELLAESVSIDRTNDKIVLGMNTNLPLEPGVGIDTSQPLSTGSVLNVSMDPRIMLPMAHRMLEEGHIARTYDENGDPDPDGIYGVTLEAIDVATEAMNTFTTKFRVWRTDEGYCGYAVAEMPLVVSDMAPKLGIDIAAGQATVTAGEGIGAAAKQDTDIVNEHQDLIDRFRKDLTDQMKDTVNFSAIDLEMNTIVFSSQGTTLSPSALTTFLDFVVVADE
jgi:hypothetical protein